MFTSWTWHTPLLIERGVGIGLLILLIILKCSQIILLLNILRINILIKSILLLSISLLFIILFIVNIISLLCFFFTFIIFSCILFFLMMITICIIRIKMFNPTVTERKILHIYRLWFRLLLKQLLFQRRLYFLLCLVKLFNWGLVFVIVVLCVIWVVLL